jgi:putative membrane protein
VPAALGQSPKTFTGLAASGWLAFAGILGLGAVLYVLCGWFPAGLPFWMPWEFSWKIYLAVTLGLGWYLRGCRRLARTEQPAIWRRISYVLGVVLMYAVVQTHYDYLSEHMFFFHRFQHLVLHHLGPFLVALAWPGAALQAGMPEFLRPVTSSPPVRWMVDVVQHPVVAPCLFVGLIYFWLIPSVHTFVMLNDHLYYFMNWTMAVDGLFFWFLILDPNPRPPARVGFGVRAILTMAVVPPQIAVGAVLALSSHDFYPVYEICGRILPISPLSDQHYGGLILWIPSSMMSVVGLLLVLNNLRKSDERRENALATLN